ncbi:dTDP-4-dehydrorhamnose reductase [Methylocapsa palsarum]|uniref:dTDP-4-dehydrorhamnose reductase n=1 Tax=Methylocapsa palsarum TaxID=1612308 RepID=A0A1I4BYT0_9HYPH|nr:dTDP-4-dehydrorhamnose reductase [Methylocapsa palsarum]SFK73968.1 dTDP-4-dehydrorhamnose reductase [Methylocapsa palsarum]
MILIFGGGGQLGQELQRTAALKAMPYTAISHADVDISDTAAVSQALSAARPSIVVNAAAYTKVDLAEKDPDAARLGNEIGPGVIAAACAAAGTPLIHISTDYVFDGSKEGPYVETDPIAPLGVYGATKAAGEEAVRKAAPRHVILRTSWVFGAFGANFLKTMLRLARERDELRVVADQRGCPTSTGDIAGAILQIAPRLRSEVYGSEVYGLYHFAGAGSASWHEFASRIIDAQAPFTGRHPKVTAIATSDYPTPARRPANSVFDCGKFIRTFGFGPRPWTLETDAVVRELFAAD